MRALLPKVRLHPGRLRLLVVAACALALQPAAVQAASPLFDRLQARLVSDGFAPGLIAALYRDPRVRFEEGRVSSFFVYSEARLNYEQFLRREPISRARRYMEAHGQAFAKARSSYGVSREAITAIILVETRLGTATGNSPVLGTLSTMAALKDPEPRKRLWRRLNRKHLLSRKKFELKARRKSQWAYRELKAFLAYSRREGIDPLQVRGSFAGAVGIAQFLPSNILNLGRDGNGDGRVNLFDHTDAIVSIANYLYHHGWRPGISRQEAYRVMLRYNYSRFYANTVLKIIAMLEG